MLVVAALLLFYWFILLEIKAGLMKLKLQKTNETDEVHLETMRLEDFATAAFL